MGTLTYVPGSGFTAWDSRLGCPVTWDGTAWVAYAPSTPTGGQSGAIALSGAIGEGRCTADEVRAQLARAGDRPVTLTIDSQGGLIREGVRIAEALARHRAGVTARVKRADSIASVI